MKHRGFLLPALLLVLVLMTAPAQAAQDLYTVSDIQVSASAANATEARAKAMEQAEQKAYKQLMERMVSSGMLPAPAAIQPHQISALVTGYEVQKEKIGPKSYAATLTVNFDPSSLQQIGMHAAPAQDPNLPYATNPGGEPVYGQVNRLLVVPALRTQGGILLWDAASPWQQAWQRKQGAQWGRFQIVIPEGDAADQRTFDTAQLQTVPTQSLQQLAQRYGASDVAVADASLVRRSNGRINLDVKLTRLADTSQKNVTSASAMDVGDSLFQIGVDKVMQSLPVDVPPGMAQASASASHLAAQPLPYNTPTPSAAISQIKLLTPLESIRQWAGIRRKLEGLPMVKNVQVSAMTTRQADAYISFTGTVTGLADAMQAQGYQVQRQNSYWVLIPN